MIDEQKIFKAYEDAARSEVRILELEQTLKSLQAEIRTERENRCKLMNEIRNIHHEISEVGVETPEMPPPPDMPDSVIPVTKNAYLKK